MARRFDFARVLAPVGALALLASACDSSTTAASSAFSFPIDFAYACEGEGRTVAPENDETASSTTSTRMCPDLEQTVDGTTETVQGDLLGVVLDRQPGRLIVIQLNPATGARAFLDADFFVPGVSGIPVGDAPVRVLRAPDWSAFYALSAGDRRVDRVVLHGFAGGVLSWSSSSFDLPGTPIDGAVIGTELVVVPQDASALWVYDLAASADAPPLRTVAMPDRVQHIERLDDHWLVTFRSRPTLAVVTREGTLLGESGLVAACRDGLDDDDDGLTDKADPDCLDRDDDDEGEATGAPRAEVGTAELLPSFDGAAPCDNGVDDDGDGATDFPADLACADADDDGELRPACNDGLDNDGDGASDLADASCYSASHNYEGQLPSDGPFHPTFIDGGDYGRFVYVLDERTSEILVFAWDGSELARVDVNAADAEPPVLTTVPFGSFSSEPTESFAVPAIRSPALARRGVKNIQITDSGISALSSGRLRGEIWDRLIAAPDGETPSVSLTPNSVTWKPSKCAPTPTDRCAQPALDDATWFGFGPNLDGRIQLIEAIRRGTPVHRLAQRVTDISQRKHDVSAPRLTLRGRLINARGEPARGLPFIGAAVEEMLVERVADETPERLRRFGIWPPADLETTTNETWSVSYEGRIPGAAGELGRLGADDTFVFESGRFCEAGVAPGDWLQLVVPVSGVAPELVHTAAVTLADGRACPTRTPKTATIEVAVTNVGMSTLTLDPSSARLRPTLPELDTDAVSAQALPRRACEEALDALDDVLGLPEQLASTDAFAASNLPASFAFSVRAAGWIAVGTRSGFLHRQRWDRAAGTCQLDESLDPRLVGRISEVPDAVGKYAQCPPSVDELRHDVVGVIAPEANRFFNPSFGLDIFPACDRTNQTGITAVASQQDTTFTFGVTGPHQGSALSVSDPVLLTRVPIIDFRRQQVQLDSAARRASILQLRLGDPRVIATYE